MLQQILFYRELGFELKRINESLSQRTFEKISALKSHRQVLEENVMRARTLIEAIDKTISHLKGTKRMNGGVPAGIPRPSRSPCFDSGFSRTRSQRKTLHSALRYRPPAGFGRAVAANSGMTTQRAPQVSPVLEAGT